MLRCSPEAFAKCPTRKLCGNVHEATFTEDSECAQFNRSVLDKPMTNADRIRSMSDEELACAFLCFCPGDSVFDGMGGRLPYSGADGKYYATSDEAISEGLKWLRQPAEEET